MHKMAACQFPLSVVPVCPEIGHIEVVTGPFRENGGRLVATCARPVIYGDSPD